MITIKLIIMSVKSIELTIFTKFKVLKYSKLSETFNISLSIIKIIKYITLSLNGRFS